MMAVFEVYLVKGKGQDDLLTPEVLRETKAQIMTIDEAEKVGFRGIEPVAGAGEVRLIAVVRRDAPWIHRTLEGNEAVASFRVHEVG
jgi:hypothetical protein